LFSKPARRCPTLPVLLALALTLAFASGCQPHNRRLAKPEAAMPARDINDVLRDHDDRLLALPGVVGVYVGLLEDEKTACLKVMVARMTPELKRAIPKTLEGYTVVIEETGVIRPMPGQ
jgi:hypothetical protein